MRAREFSCPSIAIPHYTKKHERFSPCISKNNYFLYISVFSIISSEMEQYITQYENTRNFSIYNHKDCNLLSKLKYICQHFLNFVIFHLIYISLHLHLLLWIQDGDWQFLDITSSVHFISEQKFVEAIVNFRIENRHNTFSACLDSPHQKEIRRASCQSAVSVDSKLQMSGYCMVDEFLWSSEV